MTQIISTAAAADELLVSQGAERDQPIEVTYRFVTPATGRGYFDIEWSDVAGRVVERRRIPIQLADTAGVGFALDGRRTATTKNRLDVHLSFDSVEKSGGSTPRQGDHSVSFIVPPSDHPWSDYQIIMWHHQTAAGYTALKRLGITAGMAQSDHRDGLNKSATETVQFLLDNDLRFYVENIATDFYSPYHRWDNNREVNWRFLEAKERHWKDPRGLSAFMREPSLSDPEWLQAIEDRLTASVNALHPYRPLFYNLGDEPGIGDLAAFWDFDFSDASLVAMRNWLKDSYGSLAALNKQWGTVFNNWEVVVPMTTDQAMQRADQNFSAWADFKEWMDIAFARAIASGTSAVHAADPAAVAAIEGAQIPGWGGYDYSRLAGSIDGMELYDYGENVELARSFNHAMILLTTSSTGGPFEAHRVWRELLRGARGLILWDPDHEFVDEDGNLGDRARDAATDFADIRGGLGALLINSHQHTDPIAILYSPPSMRVQWLLDRKMTGEDWSRRNASTEYEDDTIRMTTRNFAHALRHLSLQYRFISPAELGQGALEKGNYRVLILPHTIAIGPSEVRNIRDFVRQGGTVISDGEPGLFDQHGRRAEKPLLADVFDGPPTRSATSFAFGKGTAAYLHISEESRGDTSPRLARILKRAGVTSPLVASGFDGQPLKDVETSIFENGQLTIVGLQRDYLPPSGDSRETAVIALPRPANVYDLRAQRQLGNTDRLELELSSVEPALFTVSEQLLHPPEIIGPRSVHRGGNAEFLFRSDTPAAHGVIRLDVIDPEGTTSAWYSGNLLVEGGAAAKLLPIALNDKTGAWGLRATDLLSGETASTELTVEP